MVPNKHQAALRDEQVQAEAYELIKSGEAPSLEKGLELAVSCCVT